jgi:ABC-2 type transport system permease protein
MPTSALRRHFATAGCYARLSVLSQLEYPLSLLSWALLVPFHWITGLYLLRRIATLFHSLGGWSSDEVTFIYGLALLSHGLTILFFIQTWALGDWAARGRFSELQVRPLNVYFHFVCSSVNLIGILDLIPGLAIFLHGCRATGFELSLGGITWLGIVVVAGLLLRVGLYTAAASIAFWTKRSGAVVGLTAQALEQTTMYPLNIYPYAMQMVLTFLIPVGLVVFAPSSQVLRDRSAAWSVAGAALAAGALTFFLGYRIFCRGLERSDSAGS